MKISTRSALPVLALSCLLSLPLPATAAPSSQTRDYRPLAAKAVRVTPAGLVKGGVAAGSSNRKGWQHFDRGEWEKAMDCFLTALEADSGDASSAEGLTMAVYRSGDPGSAAELAEEFSLTMPWLRQIVAEAALTEVKGELDRGDLVSAESLVRKLPHGGGAYDELRRLIEGATVEATETPGGAVAATAGN